VNPEARFYALNYDWNNKRVQMFDIFESSRFVYDVANINAKHNGRYYLPDYEEDIRIALHSQFGHRREYEISVGDAFEDDVRKLEKWDIYKQCVSNLSVIADLARGIERLDNE